MSSSTPFQGSGAATPSAGPPAAAGSPAATSAKAGATVSSGTKPKKKKPTVAKASDAAGTQAKVKKPSRKKKPSTKTNSAASTQAIHSDARAAQQDLVKQRALAAAKKADPLWYRIEDVLPVLQEPSAMTSNTGALPEQVQLVETALGNNGLSRADVTPQAMACLLEQARRFAHELVSNAQDYAFCAGRHDISKADFMLAAEMRPDHQISLTSQLPKLNILSQQLNRAPLPPIPPQCYSGVLLPPKQHQLTSRTYDVIAGAQVTQKMIQKVPDPPKRKQANKNQPSYGASRGRQIPVKLKSQPTPASGATSDGTSAMDVSAGRSAAASTTSR